MKVFDGIDIEGGAKLKNVGSDLNNKSILTLGINGAIGQRQIIDKFTELTDTPSSIGSAGQIVQVNTAGNALEFGTAPSGGATEFTQLNDVPNSYAGQTGRTPQVDDSELGMRFSYTRQDHILKSQTWTSGINYGVFDYNQKSSFEFTLTFESTTSSTYSFSVKCSYTGGDNLNGGVWDFQSIGAGSNDTMLDIFSSIRHNGSGDIFRLNLKPEHTVIGTATISIINKTPDYVVDLLGFNVSSQAGSTYMSVSIDNRSSVRINSNGDGDPSGVMSGMQAWQPFSYAPESFADIVANSYAMLPMLFNGWLMEYAGDNVTALQSGQFSFGLNIQGETLNNNFFLTTRDLLNQSTNRIFVATAYLKNGSLPVDNSSIGMTIVPYLPSTGESSITAGVRVLTKESNSYYKVNSNTAGGTLQTGKIYLIKIQSV